MVKVLGPCFSLEASGQLGHTLIFQKNGFGMIAKIYKKPAYSLSFLSTVQRAEYGNAAGDWRTATADIKKVFNDETKGVPLMGYNLFLKDWFIKRNNNRYGHGRYGLSLLGMGHETVAYPQRLEE